MNKLPFEKRKKEIEEKIAARGGQKKRFQGKRPTYTMILWPAFDNLGVTVHEYVLGDCIDKLCKKSSPVPGWCIASKEHLGTILRLSLRTVHNLREGLVEKGLVEVQEGTGYLCTTAKWSNEVDLQKDKVFGKR